MKVKERQASNREWHIRWPDDPYSKGKWTEVTFTEHELENDELDIEHSFYIELVKL